MAEKQTKKTKNSLARKNPFPHKNLISVKDLGLDEIQTLFDLAEKYEWVIEKKDHKLHKPLQGLLSINLFFEPSTRTRISFEIAAKRLGMEIVNFAPSESSLHKGESHLDTIVTIYQMDPDLIILRSKSEKLLEDCSTLLECPVINAGDGTNEHPTQALLDAFTIYSFKANKKLKDFNNLTISICGDIKHSRVAKSNLYLLTKLGAKLQVCGPKKLIPNYVSDLGVKVLDNFEDCIKNSDVLMMLRYQQERMENKISINEIKKFQLNKARFKLAKKDAILLHPGPINYGREIAKELEGAIFDDDPVMISVYTQVRAGLVIRMAILDILTRPARNQTK